VDSLARGIRLFVGLVMVAGGTALAAPTALQVAAWWQARQVNSAFAEAAFSFPPVVDGQQPTFLPPLPATGGAMRLEYVPPPVPPEPLPPSPSAFAGAAPDLGAAYRSTLQAPPPPLLDGQSPPPLSVGWTGREPVSRPPVAVPATEPAGVYVVRDGDDLTGLATRFYGHPAAAAAIWQANRGLLRDPHLLPIGLTLVLPPPSQVAAMMRPTDQAAIEPAADRPLAPPRPTPASATSWLTDEPVSGPGRPSS
jgi:phage tail protein X